MSERWVFHEDRCKGCALCTLVCPRDLVFLSERMNRQGYRTAQNRDVNECISCGFCAMTCPDVAIEVHRPEKKGAKQ